MERESAKHSPKLDDEMKAEVEGMIRGTGPTRAEEWHDPEPFADDDPVVPPFGAPPAKDGR